ncbi:MAG: MBL fold metallo-hydrolase [Thiotrichales bacterium]|nr:MBL fold metallo-hydrolase [Thiotrichales bacterium]
MIIPKQRRFIQSALLFTCFSVPTFAIASTPSNAYQDPFINSFASYAAEIKAMETAENASASHAFANYANDVSGVEKKAGYIGDELPIPKATKVMEGVYTVVGSFIWGTTTNFGLNNNLSAIIFDDGVFIYNGGPNEAVAYSFHQQIKRITNKPVKWLAVENDQGHAYLGSSYWHDIGVKNLYSEKRANENFHRIFDETKERYAKGRGPIITQSSYDVTDKFTTFTDSKTIDVGGGETVQLINFGGGHTPSMTGMYIPSRKLLFTGDLGFNERLPGLLHDSHFREWITSFEKMVAMVPEDVTVIPGHGTPTDLATLKRQTYDYFVELYQEVQKVVDTGGSLADVDAIDQSKHQDRPVFGQLSISNARHIYNELMTEKRAQK